MTQLFLWEATWFCGQPRVKELFSIDWFSLVVMETLQNATDPDSAFARMSRMLLKLFAMTWYSNSECPLVYRSVEPRGQVTGWALSRILSSSHLWSFRLP